MNKLFAFGSTLLGAAIVSFPTLADMYGAGPGGWQGGWGWGWGHMIFGPLMMIAFWGGLIALIVVAVRWLGRGPSDEAPSAPRKTALDILQERFARGDIDKDEFEQRKSLLAH